MIGGDSLLDMLEEGCSAVREAGVLLLNRTHSLCIERSSQHNTRGKTFQRSRNDRSAPLSSVRSLGQKRLSYQTRVLPV